MSKKSSIYNEEFEHYINNSIVSLFPDLEGTPGKHILFKVNSGPGCNGRDLLNKCQFKGVCINPSLPKATSLQQETEINNGSFKFKGVVLRNLAINAMTCYAKWISMSLGTLTFGLMVYGGVCPDSGITLENALESTSDKASNKAFMPLKNKYLNQRHNLFLHYKQYVSKRDIISLQSSLVLLHNSNQLKLKLNYSKNNLQLSVKQFIVFT